MSLSAKIQPKLEKKSKNRQKTGILTIFFSFDGVVKNVIFRMWIRPSVDELVR